MERFPIDAVATEDRRFCISYPLSDESLEQSLNTYGMLSPCLLIDLPPIVMVTGFKRLEAARKLGMSDVPGVIISTSQKEALLTAIMDNLGRGLNAVEKAHAVERLLSFGFTADEIREVVRLLGFQFHERTATLCRDLASAGEETKAFVVATGLSVDNSSHLFAFTPDERDAIIPLLSGHRPSASNTREVLQALQLLKVQGKELPLAAMAEAGSLTGLKKVIKKAGHPILSSYEERMAEIMREVAPAPGMEITVDPFFEREGVQVTMTIRDERQAGEFADRLKGMTANGYFRRILDLTGGRYRRD